MDSKSAGVGVLTFRNAVLLGALAAGTWLSTPPQAFADAVNVVEISVTDLQEGYAAGSYTAVEVTNSFLDRIDTFDPVYNAFITVYDRSELIARAEALDAQYASGGPVGALHGVPIVLKDNIDQAGKVTTAGFAGFSGRSGGVDNIPLDDAAVVTRLQDAGAIILGKTNMPDFAADGTRSRSSVEGEVLNPYNVDKVPGGSSGGTATAVNASLAVFGLGTETGGSIENPASAQALVGVKPTFGLTPLEGVVPLDAVYRDVVGPLARNVTDAAIALDVLAGPTIEDPATFASVGKIPPDGYAAGLSDTALEGKRFGLISMEWRAGLPESIQFLPLAPETQAFYDEAIGDLEAQGATVVADVFEGSGFGDAYAQRRGVPGLFANGVLEYLQGKGEGATFTNYDEYNELSDIPLPFGLDTTPPVDPTAIPEGDAYAAFRLNLREIFSSVLEAYDLDGLFFPQAGGPIPDLVEDPDNPDFRPNSFPELPSNIINDLGVPVVTLPYEYYDDGTPFTLAFIGDLYSEGELLAFAYDLEQATFARIAPELTGGVTVIPTPTTAAAGLLGLTLVILRKRRRREV